MQKFPTWFRATGRRHRRLPVRFGFLVCVFRLVSCLLFFFRIAFCFVCFTGPDIYFILLLLLLPGKTAQCRKWILAMRRRSSSRETDGLVPITMCDVRPLNEHLRTVAMESVKSSPFRLFRTQAVRKATNASDPLGCHPGWASLFLTRERKRPREHGGGTPSSFFSCFFLVFLGTQKTKREQPATGGESEKPCQGGCPNGTGTP
jgi:hypothetical protein